MLWPARPSFALSVAPTLRPHHIAAAAASLEHTTKPLQPFTGLTTL
jgi:hypothetical protein